MFAEKHYPEILLPEELDAYLAKGWYRMGQTIFTTHFLCFGNSFYSAIWIRLNLEGYSFNKKLRKVFNRNNRFFQVEFRPSPMRMSIEKERLYQRYKADFQGILAPSLKDSLLDGEEFNIYNTIEVAIYDERKLIGLSFFDVGKNSAASIMGIYDPDYSRYSLGFFTMLMEIYYCQENNIQFYYPGYVVPGYDRFDYKLRVGDVDYYDIRNPEWLPFKDLPKSDIPIYKMEEKLHELEQVLSRENIPHRKYYYPLFEANLFGFWRAPYFDFPLFIWCYPATDPAPYTFIVYNVVESCFQLLRCAPFDDLQFYFNQSFMDSFSKDKFFMELMVVEQFYSMEESAEGIVQALKNRKSLPSLGK